MKLFMNVLAQGSGAAQGPMPLNRGGQRVQALRDQGASAQEQNRAFRDEQDTRARGGVLTDRRFRRGGRNATGTRTRAR